MPDHLADDRRKDAVGAVQRASRQTLRHRFYTDVAAAKAAEGYVVQLDGRPVRTPARRALAAPVPALARALAAEWRAQQDLIDPATMPLTRLANVIIDGVTENPQPVAAEIGNYLASDLLFYRGASPSGLAERQARHWDPILDWVREQLGAPFAIGEGIIPVAQPQASLAAVRAAIPADPWQLGAVHAATTLTGSALLALAFLHRRVTAAAAWQAAHIDEDWNMEQWGRDAIALEQRAARLAEFKAAALVLDALGPATPAA